MTIAVAAAVAIAVAVVASRGQGRLKVRQLTAAASIEATSSTSTAIALASTTSQLATVKVVLTLDALQVARGDAVGGVAQQIEDALQADQVVLQLLLDLQQGTVTVG